MIDFLQKYKKYFYICILKPENSTYHMQEAVFIRRNIDKWKKMEIMVGDKLFTTPDDMVAAYNEITSDLAFAQTQYPSSPVTSYLNSLALGLHRDIYRQKHYSFASFLRFWTHEIPLSVYGARREMITSLVLFVVFFLVGMFSYFGDNDFVRAILGDSYVNMTLYNIERGQPMAVYGTGTQVESFLGITLNNIWVTMKIYGLGLFTSFGAGYGLMIDGTMVGAFLALFIDHNLFKEAFLAVMLHGTLEITGMIVAGGAGLLLGNGWLFPGTHTRLESFMISARRSMKVILSTVPIFIIAAFIEGFFTRFTDSGDWWRLAVILLSFAFVMFYYVYLPIKRHREEEGRG